MNGAAERGPTVGRAAIGAVLIAALVVLALVQVRLAAAPIEPFGLGAGHYAEHANRTALAILGRCDVGGSLSDRVDAFDGVFPPLVHLVGLAAARLLGPTAEDMAPVGAFWLLLLAGGVGATTARLSGDRRLGWLAAGAAVLLPALHAASTRYYFDLPMTAVLWWLPVPLLRAGERPWRSGALAGALLAAACLAKWVAVPYGAAMALGAVLCVPAGVERTSTRRNRLLALGLAALVAGALLSLFLVAAGPDNSLAAMAEEAAAHNEAPGVAADRGPVARLAAQAVSAPARFEPARFGFYAVTSLSALLSPLLGLLLLVPLVAWLRGDRAGLPLVASLLLGHAAFCLFVMEILDERFLLSALPAAAVVVALAWVRLGRRLRFAWGGAFLAVALWVAWDFHLGDESMLTRRVEVMQIAPPLRKVALRGVGLTGSVQRRGWARRDETPDDRGQLRRSLWQRVEACDVGAIGVAQHAPLVLEVGDGDWLRYAGALSELEDCEPAPAVVMLGQRDPGEPEPELVLAREGVAAPAGWAVVATVESVDGLGAVLLAPEGADPCRR